MLSWLRPESPRLRRIIWLLVLLQGMILLRIPLAIPWYQAEAGVAMPPAASAVPAAAFDVEKGNASAFAVHASNNVPKAERPVAWQPIVFGIWLAGCGITLAWWTIVYIRFAKARCGRPRAVGRMGERMAKPAEAKHDHAAIPLRITEDTGPILVRRTAAPKCWFPVDCGELCRASSAWRFCGMNWRIIVAAICGKGC